MRYALQPQQVETIFYDGTNTDEVLKVFPELPREKGSFLFNGGITPANVWL